MFADGPEGVDLARHTVGQVDMFLRINRIDWPDGTVRKATPWDRRTARSNARQLKAYIEGEL